MNPSRWQRITQLFHDALERDAAARPAFLREATADDPDLGREVETLLQSHERSDGFLAEPAWGVAADLILGEDHSLAGRRLGPYQIREEIGRGGMGVVYAAEDDRLGRTVALKALTPEFTRDPVRRERLNREARAAAALSHPAIATIFALEEIDGELYLAYELVRGRTLREELADGPLPPERLLETLIAIASALACAHEQGIVHRDLKPENIVRRTDGQIKILDFGIARTQPSVSEPTFTRLTGTGFALGTPGYMAPEQLAGGDVDARADLFAFGVLAWELSTAEHPFGADPAAVLAHMTALLEGKTARLSRPLPLPGLDAIARRCLRASPSERYVSAAALLDDLRALVGGEPDAARPPTGDRLWWWQFHQAVLSAINSALPVGIWWVREAIGRPRASTILLMVLGFATVSVALRLNLLFTSRVHPDELFAHRARLFPAVIGADVLLAAVLLVTAGLLAAEHDGIAAILLCVAISTLASLALIEPTTTRAAGLSKQS